MEDGERLIAQGKVALLVLAGGMGTRLRFDGPKGCFPLSIVKHKSLYALLAERVHAASLRYGTPLQMAIMTSPLNHLETEMHFVEHTFFGLDPSQVHFFQQEMWPLLDEEKNPLQKAPNGNGGAFRYLASSGILEQWKDIEILNVVPIDNPLADPFDAALFSVHNTLTLKVCTRSDPKEKVGLVMEQEGRVHVVEYTELQGDHPELTLIHLGLFCADISFVREAAKHPLPIHTVRKYLPDGTPVWKREEYLFDTYPLAPTYCTFVSPREACFAPLKNFAGEGSMRSVQRALQDADRRAFERVTGTQVPPDATFELAPAFHYPTAELIERWRGRQLPNTGYIEAS